MKLSPTQIRVLKALAEPGNLAHFTSGLNAYWWLSSTFTGIRAATIDRLSVEGVISIKTDSLGYPDTATITPAGREYLKLEKEDA